MKHHKDARAFGMRYSKPRAVSTGAASLDVSLDLLSQIGNDRAEQALATALDAVLAKVPRAVSAGRRKAGANG